MIRLARAASKPVLVDPKGDDYARYRGATLLTPNRSEFRQVAGNWQNEAELTAKAEKLRVELGAGCAVGHTQRGRDELVSSGQRAA